MRFCAFVISVRRIKRPPLKKIFFWMMQLLVVLYCLIGICRPVYRSLDNLHEKSIIIDQIYLKDSYDTKSSRMKLEIISGGISYYVWYPQDEYRNFSYDIKNDLLSGRVSAVKVKVISKQSVRDYLLNQKRIVQIWSRSKVYYDLKTAMIALRNDRMGLWVLFIFSFLFWLCYTLFYLVVNNILIIKKQKR